MLIDTGTLIFHGKEGIDVKFLKGSIVLIFTILLLLALNPMALADSLDCTKCHGTTVSDFNVGLISRTAVCLTCHDGGGHAYWYDAQGYRRIPVYVSGSGYFSSTAAVQSTPGILHQKHSGSNSLAGKSGCEKCHQAAVCTSCHTNVSHNLHSTSVFKAVYTYQADGATWGLTGSTCGMSQCHNLMPGVVKINPDGSQLCVNCHPRFGAAAKDSSGHPQAAMDSAHIAPAADTLNIAGMPQTVTCQGCHNNNNLSTEHTNKGKDCSVCHNPVSPLPASLKTIVTSANGDQSKRACTKCHFNTNVLILQGEHQVYHIANQTGNLNIVGGPHASCDTCHARQDLWGTISALAVSNPKNYSCLDCHKSQNNLAPKHMASLDGQEMEVTGLHPGCTTCHTPGTETANKVNQITANLKNGAQSYDCIDCHNGAALDAGHAGTIDQNCTQVCHKSALTTEHLNNPVSQANNQSSPLTCSTCHRSTDTKIKLAITVGNTNCAACHDLAHNLHMVELVPADIPLYPGFEWSVPQLADIWANETWMPAGYAGGKLLISNRKTGISGQDVWLYYKQNMAAGLWTAPAVEPDAASNFFSAEFTKDKRKVTIFYYGGENHTAGPVPSTGYKIEILYK
ncbi:MAG: cytochrome c3 family protein [Eubacteriales bacterium]